jgi:hypothetical protein
MSTGPGGTAATTIIAVDQFATPCSLPGLTSLDPVECPCRMTIAKVTWGEG